METETKRDRNLDSDGNPIWRMNIAIEESLKDMIDDMKATGGTRTEVIRRGIRLLYRLERWKARGAQVILREGDKDTLMEII
jgi:Arc/MetJ-type ribon-helix-helix transcriptional regulator